jgi:hypothetical protein
LTSLPRGGRQVLGADLNRWQGARPGLGESLADRGGDSAGSAARSAPCGDHELDEPEPREAPVGVMALPSFEAETAIFTVSALKSGGIPLDCAATEAAEGGMVS